MGEQFAVRRYEPPDAERVLTVYELALEAHGWEFVESFPPERPITDSVLGITETYLDGDGEFLVGVKDDEIIATGGFHPQDDTTAEIRKMAVHPWMPAAAIYFEDADGNQLELVADLSDDPRPDLDPMPMAEWRRL